MKDAEPGTFSYARRFFLAEEEKISVIIIWLRDFGTGTNWNYCKNLVFKSLHSNLNEIG